MIRHHLTADPADNRPRSYDRQPIPTKRLGNETPRPALMRRKHDAVGVSRISRNETTPVGQGPKLLGMTIADVEAERAAVAESLSAVGPLARTACGDWTAFDLAAHLVSAERLAVLTFVLRSLLVRGVSGSTASRAAYWAVARPEAVEMVMRCERRHCFETLIDRLRRPSPRLLLRPQVAPVTLFEFWTHHDDLAGPNGLVHAVPATLAGVIPLLLRYQVKQLPAGVRVTVRTSDGNHTWSVGPKSGPEVTLDGPAADLVRWLAGRRPLAEIGMAGPDAKVRALRAFAGRV